MKTLIKILSLIIVIFACLFIAAYAFLAFQGKAIITKQIETLTQRKVDVGYVGLTPPFNLEIGNLKIAGLAEVEHISLSPGIIGLFSGNIVLNNLKLIRPKIIYERTQSLAPGSSENVTVTPMPQVKAALKQEPMANHKNKHLLRLIFKHLTIKDGKLDFIDHTVGGNGVKITLKDINFSLTNLYMFPRSVITNFSFSGRMPWHQGNEEGRVEADGWFNLFKKDMQATLKIHDMDGVSLYPYYSALVDLEKARIENAKLNLTSEINSVNNNLTAACQLELTDIKFRARSDEEGQDKNEKIISEVLDIFKALNKKIIVNFTIKTKMTNPQFSLGDVQDAFEQRFAEAIAEVRKNSQISTEDVLMVPGKVVGGTFKGATDISKALIDGTFGLAKELKEAVEYAFKKEPRQE